MKGNNNNNDSVEVVLPASIWASILSNYCSYKDLRNCLAVSSSFRSDIPPLIERLYIFNARELHHGYAAKFPNVLMISIYSLTSLPRGDDGAEVDRPFSLCLDTARDAVAFLERFPKLEVAHIGGYTPSHPEFQKIALDGTHHDLSYFPGYCRTQGHQAAFRGMLQNFCDAFERESLNVKGLQISGIFDAIFGNKQLDCTGENRCQLCPRICQTFPLGFVAGHTGDTCLPDREHLACVYGRDGSFLKNSNALHVLLRRHELGTVRLIQQPVWEGNTLVICPGMGIMAIQFEESTLERMELLCNYCGCEASTLSPGHTFECLTHMYQYFPSIGRDGGRQYFYYMSRELFDRLTQIGFQLRESDFNVIVPHERRIDHWILESDVGNKKRKK